MICLILRTSSWTFPLAARTSPHLFVRIKKLVVHCMKACHLSLRLKQRGVRANDGVRLCLMRCVDDACGGETKGGGTMVRFCSKARGTCVIASHAKSKANPKGGCFYPCVPKKGENQVRLEPSLPASLLPPDMSIDHLLLEEKLMFLWTIYVVDACKASELKTCQNKLGQIGHKGDTPDWDKHMEAPNLENLTNADDFKTPKTV
jgi:hypothetical protein